MKKPMTTKKDNAETEERYLGYMSQHTSKVSFLVRCITWSLLAVNLVKDLALPQLLVLVCVYDLLQYLYASVCWTYACFRINNQPSYRAFWWINGITNGAFYLKAVTLIYYLLSLPVVP